MKRAMRLILTVVLIAGALGILFLLVMKFPEKYIAAKSHELTKVEVQTAENALRTVIVQAIGGTALFIGLVFTYRNLKANQESTNNNLKIATATLKLTEDGKIAERFSKSIEQLGNQANLTSRLGGIYGLERIARDSDVDYWQVMEVLVSFIKENSRLNQLSEGSKDSHPEGDNHKLPVDVQAALNVIARRRRMELIEGEEVIDLSNLDLCKARLQKALLSGARLTDSHLRRANLKESVLERANLSGAHLEWAEMTGAHLDGATLTSAHLEYANLENVDMREAGLMCASLNNARLNEAHLEGAVLKYADLRSARFLQAHLEGANMKESNLKGSRLEGGYCKGAILTGAVMDDADLSSVHFENAGLSLCSLKRVLCSGAYFEGAQLKGADLKGADLHFANFDGADLSGASLVKTELRGASFELADLKNANFIGSNIQWDQIKNAINYEKAIVPDYLREFLAKPKAMEASSTGGRRRNRTNQRLRRRTDSTQPNPIKDEEYTWRGRLRSLSSRSKNAETRPLECNAIEGETFIATREPNRFTDTHTAFMAALQANTSSTKS